MIRVWATNSAEVVGPDARLVGNPRVDILDVVNRERDETTHEHPRWRLTDSEDPS